MVSNSAKLVRAPLCLKEPFLCVLSIGYLDVGVDRFFIYSAILRCRAEALRSCRL